MRNKDGEMGKNKRSGRVETGDLLEREKEIQRKERWARIRKSKYDG